MSQDKFDAIMLLLKTLGIMAAGVVAIAKFFEYLKAKAKEKSVGAEKVKELQSRLESVDGQIKQITRESQNEKEALTRLQNDYEKLKGYIWDLLGRK